MSERKHDPSDAGAPPGAPLPVAPSPELVAALAQSVDETELAEELRELRAGGGRTLDQFIGELEEVAPTRARLKELTEAEKGYIAGIIDGEGCIDITTAGERYNLRVVIKTTSEPLAHWLIEATGLGAKLQERQDKRINARGKSRQKNYEWRVFTNQALALLEAVRPHVVVKTKQVACAIEFQQLDPADRKTHGKAFQTRLRKEHLPSQHTPQAPTQTEG